MSKKRISEESRKAELFARRAKSLDPKLALPAVIVLRHTAEELMRLQVERARDLDWSWGDIASMLGITRQAAQQRFGHMPRPRMPRATKALARKWRGG